MPIKQPQFFDKFKKQDVIKFLTSYFFDAEGSINTLSIQNLCTDNVQTRNNNKPCQ